MRELSILAVVVVLGATCAVELSSFGYSVQHQRWTEEVCRRNAAASGVDPNSYKSLRPAGYLSWPLAVSH